MPKNAMGQNFDHNMPAANGKKISISGRPKRLIGKKINAKILCTIFNKMQDIFLNLLKKLLQKWRSGQKRAGTAQANFWPPRRLRRLGLLP
jgi:hypothetical protein